MSSSMQEAAVIVNKYLVSLQAYTPLYSRPKQRQRWDEHEGHAVIPWADVFFDLFYVAAAYNLANILVNNPTWQGLLYFAGCFWAVHYMWLDELFYEARYVVGDDTAHRVFHVSYYLVVATAILHIRKVELMSTPSDYIDMFVFSLACVLANLFTISRYVEVIFFGEGEHCSKVASRRDIFAKIIPTTLYLSATVVSGMAYYGDSSMTHSTTDVPIILLCCAVICESIYAFLYLRFFVPNDDRRKEVSVPINTDYCIHRYCSSVVGILVEAAVLLAHENFALPFRSYGEWVMLMLGESILSLLIVEVVSKGSDYYVTFYCGIVSVTLLMYLYFVSGPTHAEEHALHSHKRTSYGVLVLMQFYSAGLVIVGACYKLFMYEYTYENYEEEFGRLLDLEAQRSLAGGSLGDLDEGTRRLQIAYFFSFSLGVVWVCSDLLTLMHKGLYYNWERLYNEGTEEVRHAVIMMIVARIGLVGFIATLWLYLTDPHHLAAIGMCCILVQVALRAVGNAMFPHEKVDSDSDSSGSKLDAETGLPENDAQEELVEGEPIDLELGKQEAPVPNVDS